MKSFFGLFTLGSIALTIASSAWGAEVDASEPSIPKPLQEGASSVVRDEPQSELVLRLGNESNQPDGIFGPATYGLRANHTFDNQFTAEAGLIRLHEPGTPSLNSFLDEAQFSLGSPELPILGQPIVVTGTAWKNRMIDMYTTVGGLQLRRKGVVTVNTGFYVGGAARLEDAGSFWGLEVGASGEVGPVGWAISHLNGRIARSNAPENESSGFYRKTGVELSIDVHALTALPFSVTFAAEDRYFSFGPTGSASESQDELIFISGLEVHFEALIFH